MYRECLDAKLQPLKSARLGLVWDVERDAIKIAVCVLIVSHWLIRHEASNRTVTAVKVCRNSQLVERFVNQERVAALDNLGV